MISGLWGRGVVAQEHTELKEKRFSLSLGTWLKNKECWSEIFVNEVNLNNAQVTSKKGVKAFNPNPVLVVMLSNIGVLNIGVLNLPSRILHGGVNLTYFILGWTRRHHHSF